MDDRHAVASEVLRLIDEQMQALEGRLSDAEAARYADRKNRIEQLLSLLDENAAKYR